MLLQSWSGRKERFNMDYSVLRGGASERSLLPGTGAVSLARWLLTVDSPPVPRPPEAYSHVYQPYVTRYHRGGLWFAGETRRRCGT